MDIAKRIQQLCTGRDISIYRLAELSDVSQSTLNNIMSGRNTTTQVETIEKICAGLDITLAQFFEGEAIPIDLPAEALPELKNYKDYLKYKYRHKK